MKDKETALCYKSTAIEMLGITVNEFDKLNLPVEDTVPNPHHKSSPAYLYNRKLIKRYAKRKSVAKIRAHLSLLRAKKEANRETNKVKRQKRLAKEEETRRLEAERQAEQARIETERIRQEEIKIRNEYSSKYHTLQNALPDAAEAMLSLNRYAKHLKYFEDCHEERHVIYNLKNRFVKLLYLNGYCSGAFRHIFKNNDEYGIGQNEISNVLFEFDINGKKYRWHQPEYLIDFEFKLTKSNVDTPYVVGAHAVDIQEKQLSEAKWLVKWVVEKWEQDVRLEKVG